MFMSTRREFLTVGGAAAVIAAMQAGSSAVAQAMAGGGQVTTHTLPELPYPYDALEPYIDAKTMELHHSKHHAAYVKGLNEAEAALAEARAKGDFAAVQALSKKAAFNGGGHFLHSMFWKIMAPAGNGGGGEPSGELAEYIEKDFGDFKSFRAHFSAAAAAVEGSGWALLHYRPQDDSLIILQAENQHKLSPWGVVPIMGIDVWEHAYYLKYQNRCPEYIEAWWNVVNWAAVAENLKAARKA